MVNSSSSSIGVSAKVAGAACSVAHGTAAPVASQATRLSRKRPRAAALPALSLDALAPPAPPSLEDDRKRIRYASSTSFSSQGSSSGDSSSSEGESSQSGVSGPRHIQNAGFVVEEEEIVTPPSAPTPAGTAADLKLPFGSLIAGTECASATVSAAYGSGSTSLLVHNSKIGDYVIVGTGRETKAVHTGTEKIFDAQVISRTDMNTLLHVSKRLDQADELCDKAGGHWGDIERLSECILPSECEVVEELAAGPEGNHADYGSGRLVLFTPLHHGSLHSRVHQCGGSSRRLPEREVAGIFRQVVTLVSFCHAIGIVLRDLKARKLVFTDPEMKIIRFSDVLNCTVCESPEDDVIADSHGSPAYVPPEMLVRNTPTRGKPADVWALGVLSYVLLVGQYPFFDTTPFGIFNKIRTGRVTVPIHVQLSPTAKILLFGMLRRRPADRPSARFLMSIPWCEQGPQLATRMRYREYISSMAALSSIPPPEREMESDTDHMVPVNVSLRTSSSSSLFSPSSSSSAPNSYTSIANSSILAVSSLVEATLRRMTEETARARSAAEGDLLAVPQYDVRQHYGTSSSSSSVISDAEIVEQAARMSLRAFHSAAVAQRQSTISATRQPI